MSNGWNPQAKVTELCNGRKLYDIRYGRPGLRGIQHQDLVLTDNALLENRHGVLWAVVELTKQEPELPDFAEIEYLTALTAFFGVGVS